MKVVLITAKR